jgi:hypothetical protein
MADERTYKTKPLYLILSAAVSDPKDFEERVTELLAKGWLLHGAPAVNHLCIYSGALTRPAAEIAERVIKGK